MAQETGSLEVTRSFPFDTIRIPIFVVDQFIKVQYANIAGAELTHASGQFQINDGVLSLRNQPDNLNLRKAVTKASADGARDTLVINDPRSGNPQFVCVMAVHTGEAAIKEALIWVSRRDVAYEQFEHILHELFRLSPSECAIAGELVNGLDAQRIADCRHAKVTTVRSQIATIMLKTRTHRLGELVALLAHVSSLP